MRRNAMRAVGMFVLAAICLPLLAAGRQDAVEPISKDVKDQTIAELTKDLKATYFFPDLAAKVEQDLNARNASGEFDKLTDGQQFATSLTDDMRAICHDAHLHVSYSQTVLPVRKNNLQPSKAELDNARKRANQLNGGFESVQRFPGNIGYVEVRGFFDKEVFVKPAQAAMAFLANTDALIIDLRRNGGGDPASVQYLCSYLFDQRTHLNDISVRGQGKQEFWTVKVPGKTFPDRPVYVLTSKRTGSGAEECAYDIQCLHRGTIIGESTWGGANPGEFVRLNDHFNAFIPNGQAMNPYTHKNWEGTGVQPDVPVPAADALKIAQTMALKDLIAKAKSDDDKQRWTAALNDLQTQG